MGSSSSNSANRPVVVVVGGGYGGVKLAKLLDAKNKFRVVLIDRKNYFFHNVGALRAAVKKDYEKNIMIPYDSLFKNDGVFVRGSVTSISPSHVIISGHPTPLQFNYLVIATGSSYAFPCKVSEANASDAIRLYAGFQQQIAAARRIVIVGGGPVGVELAGEIYFENKEAVASGKKTITLIHSGERLCKETGLNEAFHNKAMEKLHSKNINVKLGERVLMDAATNPDLAKLTGVHSLISTSSSSSSDNSFNLRDASNSVSSGASPYCYHVGDTVVRTDKGSVIEADLVMLATGTRINNRAFSSAFAAQMNSQGRLKVDDCLRVEGFENIFALGDCAGTYARMAFLAGLQAASLADNLPRHSSGQPLQPFQPPKFPAGFVPIGADDGVGQFPNEKGTIVGGTITGMIKSKGLFTANNWKELNKKPPSGDDEVTIILNGGKVEKKQMTLAAAMNLTVEEAQQIVKQGFQPLPIPAGATEI